MIEIEGQVKQEGKIDLFLADKNKTILFDTKEEYENYIANNFPSSVIVEESLEQLYQKKLEMDVEYKQLQQKQVDMDTQYDELINKIFQKINIQ